MEGSTIEFFVRAMYAQLQELRAQVPRRYPSPGSDSNSNTFIQLLDMKRCEFVFVTPDCRNIHYEVRKQTEY